VRPARYGILGIGQRSEHPVAVGVQRGAMGLHQAAKGILIAPAGRPQQPALARNVLRIDGRRALGCQKGDLSA
jgi:hypothetical protein